LNLWILAAHLAMKVVTIPAARPGLSLTCFFQPGGIISGRDSSLVTPERDNSMAFYDTPQQQFGQNF
jgi:hypothetical protein